jgi:DNA-binding MarR family transcriptional regulator
MELSVESRFRSLVRGKHWIDCRRLLNTGFGRATENNTYTYQLARHNPSKAMLRQKNSATLPIDSPNRRRLPILLRRAWYGLNQTFRRRIAHLGVTPDQFTAMRTILEGGEEGVFQSELTRRMASDPNTIASLLDRMAKAGLIERRVHEKDRRAYQISLKASGVEKYEAARSIAVSLQTELLGYLREEDREQFLETLATLADTCHELARTEQKRAKQLA